MAKKTVKKPAKKSEKTPTKKPAPTARRRQKNSDEEPVAPVRRRRRANAAPVLDMTEEPRGMMAADEMAPFTPQEYRMVAKRIWHCATSYSNCQGMSPFLGWTQLTTPPTCPNCGGPMRWHQWGQKIVQESK